MKIPFQRTLNNSFREEKELKQEKELEQLLLGKDVPGWKKETPGNRIRIIGIIKFMQGRGSKERMKGRTWERNSLKKMGNG